VGLRAGLGVLEVNSASIFREEDRRPLSCHVFTKIRSSVLRTCWKQLDGQGDEWREEQSVHTGCVAQPVSY